MRLAVHVDGLHVLDKQRKDECGQIADRHRASDDTDRLKHGQYNHVDYDLALEEHRVRKGQYVIVGLGRTRRMWKMPAGVQRGVRGRTTCARRVLRYRTD